MEILIFASVSSYFTFAHERCVTSSEHEELALEQKLNIHKVDDPI